MRLKLIKSQYRNDFEGLYACEFCGHEQEDYGYDDACFRKYAIPRMVCERCGMSSHTNAIDDEVAAAWWEHA